MENENKHYVEYFNKKNNWLKMIIIEIDKFLIDCVYINFFIKMYIQWSKDNWYNLSSRTLIIPRLPCFENLALLQFQLYTEAQTITQCFVCHNYQKYYCRSSCCRQREVFQPLHVLRIHTDLRKCSKAHVFDLHLKKMNPFGIHEPCIKISRSKLLFEQYRMALSW